jgi:hypothetical protein
MSWRESNTPRLSALAVAEVHFPEKVKRVRHLYQTSETFRSMCEDLAVILETLTHLDDLPPREREGRRQEYKDLEKALVSEIGEALSQSNVVSLKRS